MGSDGDAFIHDACLYSLPEEDKWDIDLWRKLILKYNASSPDDTVFRLLSFAAKIEDFVTKNRPALEAAILKQIRRDVEDEHIQRFSEEYDKQRESAMRDRELSIDKIVESQDKMIRDECDKRTEFYFRKQLNFPLGKISSDQLQVLKDRKMNASTEDLENIEKIGTDVIAEFREKAKNKYDSNISFTKLSQGLSKAEYIQTKLVHAEKTMTNIINDRMAVQILSPATPLSTLIFYSKSGVYKNAEKNPEAAKIFFSQGTSEERFNEYLSLKPQDDPKEIPFIKIHGATISPQYSDFYLVKLPADDPRLGVIGNYTGCCQSLGKQGQDPAKNSITSSKAGVYAIFRKANKEFLETDQLIAQCWTWRGKKREMTFDSIEEQIDYRKPDYLTMVSDFYTYLGHQLVTQHDVPIVLVGTGGETPDKLGILKPASCADPRIMLVIETREHSA